MALMITPNFGHRPRITAESATFNYPADLSAPVAITLTSARYEALDGAGSLDVMANLTSRAQNGPYSLTVNNTTFGGDPAANHVKRLRLEYQLGGKSWVKSVPESSVFNYPADLVHPECVPYLRKSFTLSKPVRKATIYATALGLYELRLNGSRVGDHVLAPEWTDYSKRLRYQAYDVTSQLAAGGNVLGAQVANGWYSGHIGNGGYQFWGVSPALLMQLEITYADGSSEWIATGPHWRLAPSAILLSEIYDGETRDARRAAFIASQGFRILRFSNHDVLTNRFGVLEVIAAAIQESAPSPTLPRKRERETDTSGQTS